MKVKMKVTLDRHQANDLLRLLGYEYGEGVKRGVKWLDLRQQSGKGMRNVLVQAITEEGLVGKEGAVGPTTPNLDPNTTYETAEWIFKASSHKDYHTQMNHDRFNSWVK